MLLTMGIFGAVCLVFGYCAGSAKAYWIHLRSQQLFREMEKSREAIESLKKEINEYIEDGGVIE